jgi:hypothetical protein
MTAFECAGYNLDPFEQFTDEQLEAAVKTVRLDHKITCLQQEVAGPPPPPCTINLVVLVLRSPSCAAANC